MLLTGREKVANLFPPWLLIITHRLILRTFIGRNTSRGTKSDSTYQAIPVVWFDSGRPILLTREKQEKKSLFQVLTFQI